MWLVYERTMRACVWMCVCVRVTHVHESCVSVHVQVFELSFIGWMAILNGFTWV